MCPRDSVYNIQANFSFKLYTGRLSRADASAFCQNREPSARLVVLDNPEKFQLVVEHVSAHVSTSKRNKYVGQYLKSRFKAVQNRTNI